MDQVFVLRALAEITRQLISTDAHTVFDLVCCRVAELLNAPKAILIVREHLDEGLEHLPGQSIKGAYGIADIQQTEAELQGLIHQGELIGRASGPQQNFVYDVIPDQHPYMRKFRAREGVQSFAAARLLTDQGEIGLLMICDVAARHWDETEIEILNTIAAQAALALQKLRLVENAAAASEENARLYETEHRRTTRLVALQRMSTELSTLRDENAVLNALTRYAAELSGNPVCAVVLLHEKYFIEKLVSPNGLFELSPIGQRVQLSPFVCESLLDGVPMILANIDRDAPEFRAWFEPDKVQALFLYPMRREVQTFGFLALSSPQPRAPSPSEVSAFLLLAERAAAALENARLNAQLTYRAQELQQRNEQLARLYRASGALLANTTEGLPVLAKTIVAAVLREFGQSNCSLVLVQEDGQTLKRVAVEGPYSEMVSRASLSMNGSGLIAKAVRGGQILNVPDVHKHPDYLPNWPDARSELTLPLKLGSQVIGVIDVQSAEPYAFSPDDQRVMGIFAEQSALAVEHSRLYEKTVQSLQRLTALRTVDRAISSTLDLPSTLNVLLEQVTTQLHVDAAAILLVNQTTQLLEYAASYGFRGTAIQRTRLQLGESYAGLVALTRMAIQIADRRLETDNPPPNFMAMQEVDGFVAYSAVPLVAKDLVKGVLEIHHRSPLIPTPTWLDYLETLAGQAAIAIDNASLFDDLQRSNIELAQAYENTLEGWSRALDLRDEETEGHTQRVVELTGWLARRMGIGDAALVHITRGALLHDIGKMGVPDQILHKNGPLTPAERQIMDQHPAYAYDMLSPIGYLQPALDIPYCHHEKWDGAGYPRGLKGEDIPLSARIFAIIDVWDALCSNRHYRKAWPREQVLDYIHQQRGKHFDPQVVDAFLQMIEEENL